jgi:hypothetical protein
MVGNDRLSFVGGNSRIEDSSPDKHLVRLTSSNNGNGTERGLSLRLCGILGQV